MFYCDTLLADYLPDCRGRFVVFSLTGMSSFKRHSQCIISDTLNTVLSIFQIFLVCWLVIGGSVIEIINPSRTVELVL